RKVESFRDECLNVNWFLSLEDATQKVQVFKEEYWLQSVQCPVRFDVIEVVQQHSNGPNFSTLGWTCNWEEVSNGFNDGRRCHYSRSGLCRTVRGRYSHRTPALRDCA